MKFIEYTPDRICETMGLPGFVDDPLVTASPVAVRLLLEPAFSPEICITFASDGSTGKVQIAALDEVFSQVPTPAWKPGFEIETHDIDPERVEAILTATKTAISRIEPPTTRGITVCDGVRYILLMVFDNRMEGMSENIYTYQHEPVVTPVIEAAFEFVTSEICRNALAQIRLRDTPNPLPVLKKGEHTRAARLFILGNPIESGTLVQVLRQHQAIEQSGRMRLDGQSSLEINLPKGPKQLEAYFASVNQAYPGRQWVNGIQMCRWWAELQERDALTQADIDAFLKLLNAEPDISSGWVDLGLQFSYWARQKGFQV